MKLHPAEWCTVAGLLLWPLVGRVEGEDSARAESSPPQEILIRSVKVVGHSLIDDGPISGIIEKHIQQPIPGNGTELTPQQIRSILEGILGLYHERGYGGVAVYIDPESIQSQAPLRFRGDIMRIKIVEARIKRSEISYRVERKELPWKKAMKKEGKAKPARRRSLRDPNRWLKQFAPTPGSYLKERELQEVVDRLQRHSGRRAATVIKKAEAETGEEGPGQVEGNVDVELRIVDPDPLTFYVQYGNTGSASTAEKRVRAGMVHQNLFGRDDSLSVDFQAAAEEGLENNFAAVASYDAPLWDERWRARLLGSYSEFKSTDILGPGTAFIGDGFLASGELSYNFWQYRDWFLDTFVSLSFQNSKVDSPFGTGSDVDLFDASFGVAGEKNRGRWRSSISLEGIFNLSGLSALADSQDFGQSRFGTKPDYFVFRASGFQRVQLTPWFSLFQRVGGLVSGDRLVSARELSIGGLETVRGYEEFEVLGDRGFYLHNEPRLLLNSLLGNGSFPVQIDLSPVFFDVGAVEAVDTVPGERASTTLMSVGVGGRIFFKSLFFARLYWGYALRDAGTGADSTREGDSRFHFEVTLRF